MDTSTKVTAKVNEIRKIASQMLKGHYLEAAVLLIIVKIIITVPQELFYTFIPSGIWDWFVVAYNIAMSSILTFSMTVFYMSTFRGKTLGFNSLTAGFDYAWKTIVLNLLISIRIYVGIILFVVPGIIATLDSAMAFKILADDPTKSSMECLNESRYMMRGNKVKLLMVYLSYVPFWIATLAPCVIYTVLNLSNLDMTSYVAAVSAITNLISTPIASVLQIFTIAVQMFVGMAEVAFYDLASGQLVFEYEQTSVEAV